MDNGFRWGAQQVIAGQDRSQRFAIPIPIVLDNGKIILLYTRSRYVEREEDRGCRSIFMKTSTDHGKSWSSARDITSQVSMPCREDKNGRVANPIPAGYWGWLGLGPNHGIVKQQAPNKGRILACARRDDNAGVRSYVIYSDDQGSTWRFGSTVDQKSSECTLVELPNGNVMLNARRGGETSRVVAVSSNGGVSFGPARLDPNLPEPLGGCQGSSLRYGQDILFSNPANPNDKTDGTLRRSSNGGLTWPISERYTRRGEFSAYSDLVRVNNGVGVLLEWGRSLNERDRHAEIRFLVIPEEQLRRTSKIRMLKAKKDDKKDKNNKDDNKGKNQSGGSPSNPPRNTTTLINASGHGQIVSPAACGDLIGAGGNYVEGSTRLSGKCSNAGISPRIVNENGDSHIQFGTNGATGNGANDRSELAHTTMYPFGTKLFIGYEFRLPANYPARGGTFYGLQLWQCSPASPIAGMRLSATSGATPVDFMTRYNNVGDVKTHNYVLQPNRWHRFVIAAKPAVNGTGTFQVWADGQDLGTWQGNFGIPNNPACPPEYRIKWGIYKTSQPGAQFRVDYKNFRIGTTFEAVNNP